MQLQLGEDAENEIDLEVFDGDKLLGKGSLDQNNIEGLSGKLQQVSVISEEGKENG